MGAFVARRLWQSVLVLLLVSMVSFALILFTGDPVTMMMPTHASAEDRAVMRHALGLDQPLPVQYATFLGHAVRGDFGESIKFNQPVLPLIASKLPATLLLASLSILLALAIGLPVGLLAGARPGSTFDVASTVWSLLTISVPSFWIALMGILVFGDSLRLLPVGGSGGPEHLILPVAALSAHSVGLITRLTRSSAAEEFRHHYVWTARAKGLTERAVLLRHVLRNALSPTVTVAGLQFGALIGGAVIVETVFSWPGVGWLLMQGVEARDLPLVRALVLMIAVIFILLNLLVDLSYRVLDPRVRAR